VKEEVFYIMRSGSYKESNVIRASYFYVAKLLNLVKSLREGERQKEQVLSHNVIVRPFILVGEDI